MVNYNSIPTSLKTSYGPSFQNFDLWRKDHRDHQKDAIKACENNTIGQIALPTATGKTRVQIDIHVKEMIEGQKKDQYGCFVIGAHRLALCSQLLTELVEVVVNAGISFDLLFLGSDKYSDDKIHSKFKDKGLNKYVMEATSTTQQGKVLEAYNKAITNKRHLICVSTYHSFNKLHILPEIELCTYDEAHTLTDTEFRENIEGVLIERIKIIKPKNVKLNVLRKILTSHKTKKIKLIVPLKSKIKKNFFFTATRKVDNSGKEGEGFLGMNNTEFFGKVICAFSPREMIDRGEIVPPKVHIIQTKYDGDYNDHIMVIQSIITGFKFHEKLLKEHSSNSDVIGAKLLITTTGSDQLKQLYDDKDFITFCKENAITVFAFSSEYGSLSNYENLDKELKKLDREVVMNKMRSLKNEERAILIHIDILTEGIDLPYITGVMPFRELNKLKLIQTLGRATRLLSQDRVNLYTWVKTLIPQDKDNLYSGKLKINDYIKYIKPYCYIVMPEFYKSLGDAKQMKDTLKTILNEYEIPLEQFSKSDVFVTQIDERTKRITDRDISNHRDKTSELTHLIEDLVLSIPVPPKEELGSIIEQLLKEKRAKNAKG